MGNCVPILRVSEPKISSHIDRHEECVSVDERAIQRNNFVCQITSESCFNPDQTTILREPSNTEETFFDSHLSLDSDCDDFFSVNGDLTPSLNGTPITGSFNAADVATESSRHKPCTSNKLLIDLFHDGDESQRSSSSDRMRKVNEEVTRVEAEATRVPVVKGNKSSHQNRRCFSVGSRKSRQPPNCCLPNLVVRSLSLTEKKREETR